MVVGSTVMGSSLVWPEDPQCRCIVWFTEFVGACGLCSEGLVPRMAKGPKVLVFAGVLEV